MGDKVPLQLQVTQSYKYKRERGTKDLKQLPVRVSRKNLNSFLVPVIRLVGSKTSIFSRRSKAPGDILGNLAESCCFRHCGSCLTYLRALSLRRNPRLASSGEPSNFGRKKKKFRTRMSHILQE